MGSKSIASITILILSLSIFFFANLSTAQAPNCPDMRACVRLVNDSANVVVGSPQSEPCCSVVAGLADADAAVCLCEVAKANVVNLGIDINIPVTEVLRVCEPNAPNPAPCA